MPRTPRCLLVGENTLHHCTWRSHNGEHVFATDEERSQMRHLLKKYKARYEIQIASYTLMSTHPHVICASSLGQPGLSGYWKAVNQAYARWYNARHDRVGQVVRERLSTPRIQDDRHLLTAMRYGDLNPVRAGMVRSAKDWKWSSHRHYALGEPDDLVDDVPAYLSLGRNPIERRKAYRHLFANLHRTPPRMDALQRDFVGDPEWVKARKEALVASLAARALTVRGTGPPRVASPPTS